MRAGSTLRDASWKQLSWSQEHGDEMEKTNEKVVMKTRGSQWVTSDSILQESLRALSGRV